MSQLDNKNKYNWEELRIKFFNSDYTEARGFIRAELGLSDEELEANGNIRRQINGWAEEKKEKIRKDAEEIDRLSKKKLIEKFAIKLEDVLETKKLSFELMNSYLHCFGKILLGKDLTKQEMDFMKAFSISDVNTITKWLQIELGLPTNIQEMKGLGALNKLVDKIEVTINRPKNEIGPTRDRGAGDESGGASEENEDSDK